GPCRAKDSREDYREAAGAGSAARAFASGPAVLAGCAGRRRRVAASRPGRTTPPNAERDQGPAASREPAATGLDDLRGSPLDRSRDAGLPGHPGGDAAGGADIAAGQLPAGVRARLDEEDVLQPTTHRPPAGRTRGRVAADTPGRRPRPHAAEGPAGRPDRWESVLPRRERANADGDEDARQRQGHLSAHETAGRHS